MTERAQGRQGLDLSPEDERWAEVRAAVFGAALHCPGRDEELPTVVAEGQTIDEFIDDVVALIGLAVPYATWDGWGSFLHREYGRLMEQDLSARRASVASVLWGVENVTTVDMGAGLRLEPELPAGVEPVNTPLRLIIDPPLPEILATDPDEYDTPMVVKS